MPLSPAPGADPSASGPEKTAAAAQRMPVVFVGHGSPMNALEDNLWSQAFKALAKLLPQPRAILSVSAHWFVPGTWLTANAKPRTIHDFGGFPPALYEVQYPAPGDATLARHIAQLLAKAPAELREEWGLDHGTWSVLRHLRPAADVPVVQLSINRNLAPAGHLALGQLLRPLREEGVLILGSGNVTHNLGHALSAHQRGESATPPWARRFDDEVTAAATQHDGAGLCKLVETEHGRASHPSLEHFLPLLYAMGAADAKDAVRFPITGFALSSLSMRALLWG